MHTRVAKDFGEILIIGEGQLFGTGMLPPLAHLTAAITLICHIELSHVGSGSRMISECRGYDILSSSPQSNSKWPRQDNAPIPPEFIELH
jgi:hypothetical protein